MTRRLLLSLLILSVSLTVPAQTLPRDPRALATVQQAVTAMGGTVPGDSVATGTVTLIEGSTNLSGTFTCRTRGLDQSSEEMVTQEGTRRTVYSRGRASEKRADTEAESPIELALGSQSPAFPLALLAAAMADADTALEYVGLEKLDGSDRHHVRLTNTFASKRRLAQACCFHGSRCVARRFHGPACKTGV